MAYTEINDLYDRVYTRFENEDLISKAEVLQMIAHAPAADVVEVVRCKVCRYKTQLMGKAPFAFYACSHNKGLGDNVREDDFCSYGVRKEGAEE